MRGGDGSALGSLPANPRCGGSRDLWGAQAPGAAQRQPPGHPCPPAELQRLAASVLGMESALFVPSATMANLIAGESGAALAAPRAPRLWGGPSPHGPSLPVMCHCQRRGAQLFLGQDTHLHLYEHGGAAQVSAAGTVALVALMAPVALVAQVALVAARTGQEGGRMLPSSGCQGWARRRIC